MNNKPDDEQAPVFRSWRTWYTLLIATLGVLIVLFYILMHLFS
jgi:hypothetical protein